MSRFEFGIATPADEPGLREFSSAIPMQGTIRMAFERAPDYFASLRPEGRWNEVLMCRDNASGRLAAVAHRSIHPMWVNGAIAPVGYLSGLRIAPEAQRGTLLARGHQFLRERHADGRAPFYLCTIMEDNRPALAQLRSFRCGLPRYEDLGRFFTMAVGLRPRSRGGSPQLHLRPATPDDRSALVGFLRSEGSKRQFFPVYEPDDFGRGGGVLHGLNWEDIILAWRGSELVGTAAAWDQRSFRCWRITGYAPSLRMLRRFINFIAACRGRPALPAPGRLNYFMLSLVCIRDNDRCVFCSLLDEIIVRRRGRFDYAIAGMHERNPLVEELRARNPVLMPSRLFAVAWDDTAESVRRLRPELVPDLEIGAM